MLIGEIQVWAVVVTFHPEMQSFLQQLAKLRDQVAGVVVVDNGSSAELAAALLADRWGGRLELIALGDNRGIAVAQNAGIAQARARGASHIVLFDHDSQPAPDMLNRLLMCALRLAAQGRRVASVGPCYLDERQTNPPPFIRVRGLRLQRCLEPDDGDAASVDYLIASGCLIPLDVLDVVGGMDETLFIDNVDIEWGQRARSLGYENFGCFSARMQHSLGDEPIHFMGKAYPARSPLRHYYMFRNAIRLYAMSHIPLSWKLADAWRLLLKFGCYAIYAKPQLQHIRMMSLGLLHGLAGRGGKF